MAVDRQMEIEDMLASIDEILEQAEKIAAEGLPEKAFLRMKRSALGRRIKSEAKRS